MGKGGYGSGRPQMQPCMRRARLSRADCCRYGARGPGDGGDPGEVLAASRGLGQAMEGIEMETLAENERLANRGW